MSSMSNEAKETRNAYLRAWRRANQHKVREARVRYWEKKSRLALTTEVKSNTKEPDRS